MINRSPFELRQGIPPMLEGDHETRQNPKATFYSHFQLHLRRDLLVFRIQNPFPSSLPLNGLHSCAVQTLLCLWPALVRGHRPLRHRAVARVAPAPVPSSTDVVHVVDPQQQTVVHNLETLQELRDTGKITAVCLSLVYIAASCTIANTKNKESHYVIREFFSLYLLFKL